MIPSGLSETTKRFFASEKIGGVLLIASTALSLVLANIFIGAGYQELWQVKLLGLTVEHWINDGLMAIFFLLIGLELERELYNGELSDFKHALLPIVAAAGGIAVPAFIHFSLNSGTSKQGGIGIPMATDIAFALGVLALVGKRVPVSLKVFLAAFAVMDDLGAIVVIALFYTSKLSLGYLAGAGAVLAALMCLNRFRVMNLSPYLIGGALLWFLLLRSGVHPTLAGVALAFAIPFSSSREDERSPSHRLENFLHRPVAFLIVPLFALANTDIVIGGGSFSGLLSANSLGIVIGLVIGKPLGIVAVCALAIGLGLCKLPSELNWRHIVGAGLLGGIGFTMSIFIANLAFAGDSATVTDSKIAILVASAIAAVSGYVWLRLFAARQFAPTAT